MSHTENLELLSSLLRAPERISFVTRPHLRVRQLTCRDQTGKDTGRAPTPPASNPTGTARVNPPSPPALELRRGLGFSPPFFFHASPGTPFSPPPTALGAPHGPPSAPPPRAHCHGSPRPARLCGGPRGRAPSARRGGDRSPAVTQLGDSLSAPAKPSPPPRLGRAPALPPGTERGGLGAVDAAVTAGRPLRLRRSPRGGGSSSTLRGLNEGRSPPPRGRPRGPLSAQRRTAGSCRRPPASPQPPQSTRGMAPH